MAIKAIARQLGVARNTVRAALSSDGPPKYERVPAGSVVDEFEPQIRALLSKTLGCGMKSGPLDIHVSGCLVGFVPVLLCLVRGTILKRGMQPFLIVTQLDVACNIPDSMPPGRIHGPMNPLHFQGRIERLSPRIDAPIVVNSRFRRFWGRS